MSSVNLAEVIDVMARVHCGSAVSIVARVEDFASTVAEPVAPSLATSTTGGPCSERALSNRGAEIRPPGPAFWTA